MERLSELTALMREQHPGHEFVKFAWALAAHPGDLVSARQAAQRFKLLAPTLDLVLKSAVEAGTTTSATWASELSSYFSLTRDWVAKTSKKTVLGRLDYVRVPFQTRTIISADSAVGTYVAEGGAIPVSKASLADTATLPHLKVATIAVVTRELTESWQPGTETQLNNVLSTAIVRGLDAALLDPDSTAVVGHRPASLLNGVLPLGDFTNSAAGALADIEALLAAHVAAGSDLERVLLCMHPRTVLTLSLMQNSNGNATFPNLNATGGSIVGVPVATSVSCVRSGSPNEKVVAALDGSKIVVADDGAVLIDASRNTVLEMTDAPSGSSASGTPATVVSMMQVNSVAIKLRRYVNFQRAADDGVSWMTSTF